LKYFRKIRNHRIKITKIENPNLQSVFLHAKIKFKMRFINKFKMINKFVHHSWKAFLFLFISVLFLTSCQSETSKTDTVFTELSPEKTNVTFANNITENDKNNIIQYLYYYNGGGVAAGDVNNDGLPDLYFTSNQGQNKLYLNKGKMRFEDATEAASVGGKGNWSTGVTMADVNGDGHLDIYVCNVGNYKYFKGRNELFINNKNGTFTEQAVAFNLAFEGLATQAAFFDYDNDGDLDCYLLNHSTHDAGRNFDVSYRAMPNAIAGDRLMRNDGSQFTDVSAAAGILSSKVGYGLGIALSDVNQDGCMDIYVSNDFQENDYLYYNNCDGTFREGSAFSLGHQSNFSMGSDIADFNNDALPDLVTLDMKPEDEQTIKKSAGADSYERYLQKLQDGFHYQYPRNNLHLNRGTLFGRATVFSEIGQLTGIDATDWSWSALFSDFDNDGLKDLFITNGIFRRPNDMNYLKFQSSDIVQQNATDLEIATQMPSGKVSNYCYQNKGNLSFKNVTKDWGLEHVGISNGAAYADLDGDGDMEIITNNINETAKIYNNNTNEKATYLKIKLKGEDQNTFGIGAKVYIQHQGKVFYQEQSPTRGFQSSVDYSLNFGLNKITVIDSVTVIWTNGIYETKTEVPTNQTITFRQENAERFFIYTPQKPENPIFLDATKEVGNTITHEENQFSDFSIQRLMTHALSTEGPALAIGDVDGDGMEDIFIGGSKGKSGQLHHLRFKNNKYFFATQRQAFDAETEDIDATFFDADNDGDLDLFVVTGGNEWEANAAALTDRLYLNDGKGNFTKSPNEIYSNGNGSCVRANDFDKDGDMDLFIGNRVITGKYGISPSSTLLINNSEISGQVGKGQFMPLKSAQFQEIGMVTDAIWVDYDNDKDDDLIIVGEFMAITIYENKNGQIVDSPLLIPNSEGWWNTIKTADLDNDGDLDFVVGNHGLNCDLTASVERPLEMYVHDFDANGSLEHILCYYNGGKSYPFASQDELISQVASKRKTYLKYDKYAQSQIESVFDKSILAKAKKLTANELRTVWIENDRGNFIIHALPIEAQFAPTESILIQDFDGDGNQDVILGGNFYGVIPKIGRYDASYGNYLQGDGKGNFKNIEPRKSGWTLSGEIRAMKMMEIGDNSAVIVARNNENVLVKVWRKPVE
jgi:hypothetical protein